MCGRKIESWALHSDPVQTRDSRLAFPQEVPLHKDWQLWVEFWTGWFWHDQTQPQPLGRWVNHSHQQWPWFYNTGRDSLLEACQGRWTKYVCENNDRCTRGGTAAFWAFRSWISPPCLDKSHPASIDTANCCLLLSIGSSLWIPPPVTKPSFWDFVRSHGVDWMWQYIEGDVVDMDRFNTALIDGMVMMVTDGSYNKMLAHNISGAGCMVTCMRQQKMVGGWFYERSPKAGSYRQVTRVSCYSPPCLGCRGVLQWPILQGQCFL